MNSRKKIIIAIPDCFVSPLLKSSNGKNGHGERRLYTGNEHNINRYVCRKPWKISFPYDYKLQIEPVLDNREIFSRDCCDRKTKVFKAIDECNDKIIDIVSQNGKNDVRRFYIGPDKQKKNNIRLYDLFRLSLIPKIFSIRLEENDEYFTCTIIRSDSVQTEKKNKNSHVCIEYLNFLQNIHNIEIQSSINGGEFALRNPLTGYYWPVDGYHNCKRHRCTGNESNPCQFNNNIWEFYGDYYHGNPKKYCKDNLFHNITYSQKYNQDLKKREFYRQKGFVIHIKWEKDWVEEKKIMKKNNINYLF